MKDNDSDSHYSDAFTARGSFIHGGASIRDLKMGPSNDELDELSILSPTTSTPLERSSTPLERSTSMRYPMLPRSGRLDPANDPVRFFFGPGLLMREVSRMHTLKIVQITERESSQSNGTGNFSVSEILSSPKQ